jgi:cysteine-rich repeat protein
MGLRRAWWIVVLMALLGSRTSGLAALPCNHLTNPPGAVYLYPDTPTTATFFTGNAFEIIGWDATLGDEPGPAPAIFGLATRNEANAQAVRDELNVGQMDNIIGKDFVYFPVRSSIGVMAGPDTTAIDAFVESLLAGPHVSVTPGTIAENTTLGDVANPVVAHLTGQGAGVTIATDVHVSGAGVLVVDDALTVQGRLDYDGLVIVRGPVIEKYIAIIHGSLWAADVALAVGGACLVQYSSEALGLAVQAAGTACTSPKCGDGIRTDDEACDDGNTLDGDCCSATCTLEPTGTACDDGDACTSGDTCLAGACTGAGPVACGPCMRCDATRGCIGAPASGCLSPAKSQLTLQRTDMPSQSRPVWRWRNGQATMPPDLGSPGPDAWTFCLFGGPSGADLLSRSLLPPSGTCGQHGCWRFAARGLRYDDPLRTTGIAQVKILASPDGKTSIRVLGGGASLDLATFPVEPPVTAELRKGDELCWDASYPSSSIVQGPTGLRARGGP